MKYGYPILLPGWAMHAACWGEASSLGETWEWPVQGELSLTATLAALPAAPTVYLGWSLGALLALTLAATAPERVLGLVLVGASPRFTQDATWPHGLPVQRLQAFQQALAATPDATLAEFLRWVTQPSSAARRALQTHWHQRRPASLPVLQAGLQMLLETDLRPKLARVRCPCLIIHGAHDALVPTAATRALTQALPDAQQVSLGVSHAPFLEQPQQFQTLVHAWKQQRC